MGIGFRIFGGLLLFICVVLAGVAFIAPSDFEGEASVVLVASPEKIWPLITDSAQRQKRLHLTSLSGVERTALGLPKWAEHTSADHWVSYETLSEVRPEKLVLGIMGSSSGWMGLWTYTLSSTDGIHTKVTVHEKSRITPFVARFFATVRGRDHRIKAELHSLKLAL